MKQKIEDYFILQIDIIYNSDVCWIKGIFGQYGGECLIGAGVGCRFIKGKGNGGYIYFFES